jgi:hypothetical protein
MFGELRQGLSRLSKQDLDIVAPAELADDIRSLRHVIDCLEAEYARRVERFDRDQLFADTDGSTTNWLRRNCNLSGFSADRHVKLARQLPELEATKNALQAGEIGIEHMLEIARATDDMGANAEAELLATAREKDPAEVRQAARELRHRVDAEGMARQAAEQFRKRRLRLYELADGMLGLEGALPREGGAALRLTLEAVIGVPPKKDERTQQQRFADALLALCEQKLDSGTLPSVNGRKPHLTVVVEAATLAGEKGALPARLEGAGAVSGQTARRLLCGGSVSIMAVDRKGAALDLGRSRRLASESQRRALAARDGHCRWPGCDWPARFCEPHHLDPWAEGGATNVGRMVLLCKVKHHPMVHEAGWSLVARPDGDFVAIPPWERA